MEAEHPELTTFGAVIRFAASLEEAAARHYEAWTAGPAGPQPEALAASHRKRAAQLTRMVREQLNEMTLEPISGLRAQDYATQVDSATGATEARGVARAMDLEAQLARLYDDMIERAGRALGSATRVPTRFAEQSRLTVGELQGG